MALRAPNWSDVANPTGYAAELAAGAFGWGGGGAGAPQPQQPQPQPQGDFVPMPPQYQQQAAPETNWTPYIYAGGAAVGIVAIALVMRGQKGRKR